MNDEHLIMTPINEGTNTMTLDELRNAIPDLNALRNEQFLHTATILNEARTYYSDSTVDDVTAALDAATAINFLDPDDYEGLLRFLMNDKTLTDGLCPTLRTLRPTD